MSKTLITLISFLLYAYGRPRHSSFPAGLWTSAGKELLRLPEAHSKQIPSARPHSSLQLDIHQNVRSKHIPSTRLRPSLHLDVHPNVRRSKHIPSSRLRPSLQLDVHPDVHSRQTPTTRPHPSLQLDVHPDVHSRQIPNTKPQHPRRGPRCPEQADSLCLEGGCVRSGHGSGRSGS